MCHVGSTTRAALPQLAPMGVEPRPEPFRPPGIMDFPGPVVPPVGDAIKASSILGSAIEHASSVATSVVTAVDGARTLEPGRPKTARRLKDADRPKDQDLPKHADLAKDKPLPGGKKTADSLKGMQDAPTGTPADVVAGGKPFRPP